MKASIPAYNGESPFIFVSYSHEDTADVLSTLKWLHQAGLKVWWDEGIAPGAEWEDEIGNRIENCEVFLIFVSQTSGESVHCRRELSFAVQEQKRVLAINLERASIPAGMRLNLNSRQAILKYALDEDTYHKKLSAALIPLVQSPDYKKRQGFAISDRRYIHINVVVRLASSNILKSDFSASVTRCLTWQGGVFRAHDLTSTGSQLEVPDYLLEIRLNEARRRTEIIWHLSYQASSEVVWSSRQAYTRRDLARCGHQIAESIGEGASKAISDYEVRATSGRQLSSLTFSQLILKATWLNYLDRRELDERREAIRIAKAREPHSGLPHAALASLLSWELINGISNNPDAHTFTLLGESRRALRRDGNDPAVLLMIGTAYCRIGRYKAGLTLIRRSFDLAPTFSAKDHLARSLCFAGQPEEAIALYDEIVSSMPPGQLFPYIRIAVAQAMSGRFREALESALVSTTNFPDDYYAWFVQANLLELLGQHHEAQDAIQEGQRLAPEVNIETIIKRTKLTYCRTKEQEQNLTAGLERLNRLS